MKVGFGMYEIVNLSANTELVKQVIDCLWDEWGNRSNYNYFASFVHNCIKQEGLPQFYAALSNGQLAGCAALIRNDLMSRQDLTPWLSALLIKEAYRGKGLGKLLQNHVLAQARESGYHTVYLASLQIGYYENIGWSFFDNGVLPSGELARIYSKNITI